MLDTTREANNKRHEEAKAKAEKWMKERGVKPCKEVNSTSTRKPVALMQSWY